MMIEFFTFGKRFASFDPIPEAGARKWLLSVPGGSELSLTKINGHSMKMLYVPSKDPLCMFGWDASNLYRAAKSRCSPFRLIPMRRNSRSFHVAD